MSNFCPLCRCPLRPEDQERLESSLKFLDTSFHGRYLSRQLQDPEFLAEYERMRQKIDDDERARQESHCMAQMTGRGSCCGEPGMCANRAWWTK